MLIRVETDVAASPERLYALVTDITRWAEHLPAIEQVELLTPAPVRVGTRFRETRIMQGRRATEEMTVAELAPPDRFVLTAESHGMRYHAVHTFEPMAGGTRMRLTFTGEPVTWVARLASPLAFLMRGAIRRQLAADFAALKRAAEMPIGAPGQASGKY
jgi:uncharacterized protein YndB with AHSA1/START domain